MLGFLTDESLDKSCAGIRLTVRTRCPSRTELEFLDEKIVRGGR
jgi:hypothetical protein